MAENHLTPDFLHLLFTGKVTTRQIARVLLHAHKVCPTCREAVATFFDLPIDEQIERPDDDALDELMSRLQVLARKATQSIQQAPELLAEIESMPPGRQQVAVETSKRFHSWPLGQLLLQRSSEVCPRDPVYGERLGSLTLSIADQLDRHEISELLVHALKAQAWGRIGNARRISGDLQAADEALQLALLHHQNAGTDILGEARLFEFRVSLLNSQRRIDEAQELAERVVEIYRAHGEPRPIARSLILLGNVLRQQREYADAISAYRESLVQIDQIGDSDIYLLTQHNLVATLNEAGEHEEAFALFQEIEPLYEAADDPRIGARRLWVEGQIAAALGDHDHASKVLAQVREQFLEQGRGVDAAIVSLELAAVALTQGDTARVRGLAEELLPIFHAQDIPEETMATLITFQQAVAKDEVTATLVHNMSTLLRHQRLKAQNAHSSRPS